MTVPSGTPGVRLGGFKVISVALGCAMALVLKQALADALTHATIRITTILLDMNCIGDDGAQARACQTLRTANATTWLQNGTLLLELCHQALAAASAHNATITMISLGYNRIGAAGIQAWVFQMFRMIRWPDAP